MVKVLFVRYFFIYQEDLISSCYRSNMYQFTILGDLRSWARPS